MRPPIYACRHLLTLGRPISLLPCSPSLLFSPLPPPHPLSALQGVMKFFRELYANADDDMRRAMLKSYQESGG